MGKATARKISDMDGIFVCELLRRHVIYSFRSSSLYMLRTRLCLRSSMNVSVTTK